MVSLGCTRFKQPQERVTLWDPYCACMHGMPFPVAGLRWCRYGGDVWPEQPAPKDHPWRSMPNHAMTPHLSGTTLDAQVRPSAGACRVSASSPSQQCCSGALDPV